MEQHFYVLFNREKESFFRDCQLGDTKDMLKAQRFSSSEEGETQLKYFTNRESWIVKKVTVSLED